MDIPSEYLNGSVESLLTYTSLVESENAYFASENRILQDRIREFTDGIARNEKNLKRHKQLPFLVATVAEVVDLEVQGEELGSTEVKEGKSSRGVIVKTSSRQTIFLPNPGLVPANELRPNDLVACNRDSYLIYQKMPTEFDTRVKAMQLDSKPSETYADIGGLDNQIEELIGAIVLPLQRPDLFESVGISPPKGVLLYGPPGTGKTLLARACAAQVEATFLKLAGPQLVQMYIGEGAMLVREAFALAKEKNPAIIFIDELDAVGAKRSSGERGGSEEVHRTMLELLNQLDGFSSAEGVKVIAATNRVDILDPALLRSGRLDRKIELPNPNEEARVHILKIHSRKMKVDSEVNFAELGAVCVDFNGAQLKAVCVEAGMNALRREALMIDQQDFIEGIAAVQSKKKQELDYFQ
eukprot:TRINITY_DN818_c0_g1_i1.p1 TRINITY_DN818_c0_g1~~TRINITY_DN818_c0_g1_i1.p1  ORF type:complete len:412 (+),score=99.45 TRINITY_DN818_c0_g1_i1:57-1292(+)